jgi:hypothetical protein
MPEEQEPTVEDFARCIIDESEPVTPNAARTSCFLITMLQERLAPPFSHSSALHSISL